MGQGSFSVHARVLPSPESAYRSTCGQAVGWAGQVSSNRKLRGTVRCRLPSTWMINPAQDAFAAVYRMRFPVWKETSRAGRSLHPAILSARWKGKRVPERWPKVGRSGTLCVVCRRLPLRHAAGELFDLLLLLPARSGALGLRSGFLAGGALQLLAFQLVFNLGGVCHV